MAMLMIASTLRTFIRFETSVGGESNTFDERIFWQVCRAGCRAHESSDVLVYATLRS